MDQHDFTRNTTELINPLGNKFTHLRFTQRESSLNAVVQLSLLFDCAFVISLKNLSLKLKNIKTKRHGDEQFTRLLLTKGLIDSF